MDGQPVARDDLAGLWMVAAFVVVLGLELAVVSLLSWLLP